MKNTKKKTRKNTKKKPGPIFQHDLDLVRWQYMQCTELIQLTRIPAGPIAIPILANSYYNPELENPNPHPTKSQHFLRKPQNFLRKPQQILRNADKSPKHPNNVPLYENASQPLACSACFFYKGVCGGNAALVFQDGLRRALGNIDRTRHHNMLT